MQYFHSNKNFNQYKPHQTFWQKLKQNRQRRKIAPVEIPQPSLKNPFKKEVVKSNKKTIVVWSIFVLIIVTWIVLILTLPYFKIQKVVIVGNKITKTTDIETYIRNFNFSRTNYFIFPINTTAENIKRTFLLEDTQISKIFPDTIQVTIFEKPASIIYDNNTNYYLLDNDGKVIKKLDEYLNIANPVVTSNSSTSSPILNNPHISTYQQIQSSYGQFPVIFSDEPSETKNDVLLSPKVIETALNWRKQLREQFIAEDQYFKTTETDYNLKIFLNKPWYLIISTESDWKDQIKNLKVILNSNQPTEYVDVRFGERVYWK